MAVFECPFPLLVTSSLISEGFFFRLTLKNAAPLVDERGAVFCQNFVADASFLDDSVYLSHGELIRSVAKRSFPIFLSTTGSLRATCSFNFNVDFRIMHGCPSVRTTADASTNEEDAA
jgi:hypothetical protein